MTPLLVLAFVMRLADNHGMHTKHGMGRLQMESTWAVLGDAGRYPNDVATSHAFMNPHLRALINDFRSAQDSAIDYLRTSLRIPLPKSGLDWVRNGHATVLDAATLLKNSGITLDPHGYGIDAVSYTHLTLPTKRIV